MSESCFDRYRKEPSRETLVALVEEVQRASYRISRPVVGQHDDAEDVAQEVVLEFLEALPGLADTEHARRWISRAALHRGLDRKRSRKRRADREYKVAKQQRRGPETTPADLDDDEKLEIHQAVGELDSDRMRVVVGHFFEGRSLASLADEIGISSPAVWKRLERAKEQLASILTARGFTTVIPFLAVYLSTLEATGTPGPLSAESLARVTRLHGGATSSAIAIGGGIMISKKLLVGGAVLVCALGMLGGVALSEWRDRGHPDDRVAEHRSTTEDESRTSSAGSLDDDIAAARIAALEAQVARLREKQVTASAEKPGTGAPESLTGDPETDLDARLDSLRVWFDGVIVEMTAQRSELEQDPTAMRAFIDRFETQGLALTEGLRDLLEENPSIFFAFLREQEEGPFVEFLVDVMENRTREGVGSWISELRSYRSVPEAFSEEMLTLAAEGPPHLQRAALRYLGRLLGLPEEHRKIIGDLLFDPDDRTVARALDAYNACVTSSGGAHEPEHEARIFELLEQSRDPMVLQSATYCLASIPGERSELVALRLLENPTLPDLDHALLVVLDRRIRNTTTQRQERYARALGDVVGRTDFPGTLDLALRMALKLPAEHARTVLGRALNSSPGDRLSGAIEQILDRIHEGAVPSTLEPLLGVSNGEERGPAGREDAPEITPRD